MFEGTRSIISLCSSPVKTWKNSSIAKALGGRKDEDVLLLAGRFGGGVLCTAGSLADWCFAHRPHLFPLEMSMEQ